MTLKNAEITSNNFNNLEYQNVRFLGGVRRVGAFFQKHSKSGGQREAQIFDRQGLGGDLVILQERG